MWRGHHERTPSPRKSIWSGGGSIIAATLRGEDEELDDGDAVFRSMRALQLETWRCRLSKAIAETEQYLAGLDRVEAKAKADSESRRSQICSQMDNIRDLIESKRAKLLEENHKDLEREQAKVVAQRKQTMPDLEELRRLAKKTTRVQQLGSAQALLTVSTHLLDEIRPALNVHREGRPAIQVNFRPFSAETALRFLEDVPFTVPTSRTDAEHVKLARLLAFELIGVNGPVMKPDYHSMAMPEVDIAAAMDHSGFGHHKADASNVEPELAPPEDDVKGSKGHNTATTDYFIQSADDAYAAIDEPLEAPPEDDFKGIQEENTATADYFINPPKIEETPPQPQPHRRESKFRRRSVERSVERPDEVEPKKLRISIMHAEGLKHLNLSGDSIFCICEVAGKSWHTSKVKHSLEPMWNETTEMEWRSDAKAVEIKILDEGMLADRTEGVVKVPKEAFSARVFEGELPIEGCPGGVLGVRIEPIFQSAGDDSVDAAIAEADEVLAEIGPENGEDAELVLQQAREDNEAALIMARKAEEEAAHLDAMADEEEAPHADAAVEHAEGVAPQRRRLGGRRKS